MLSSSLGWVLFLEALLTLELYASSEALSLGSLQSLPSHPHQQRCFQYTHQQVIRQAVLASMPRGFGDTCPGFRQILWTLH